MKKMVMWIFCDGNGMNVIERKLEFKIWPWNDVLLCRVTLEEHCNGDERSAPFWVKKGTTQEVFEPCA